MSFVFRPAWHKQETVNLIRIIGNPTLKRLDPFLLFDYFKSRLPAGFPDHPHRGFQTVTYMVSGKVHHEDFKGHKGTIGPGDIQWMTAGKGIMHAQIPASDKQDSIGFQLWLNLKAKDKMIDPKYQQYRSNQIPIIQKDGVAAKIICGNWQGQQGPISYNSPSHYMDIKLSKGGHFEIPIEKTWNSMIFPYQGEVQYTCENKKFQVKCFQCCVLQKSDSTNLVHHIKSSNGASFMLISGQPLNEPVWTRKLFVMNTKQEVNQAEEDFKQCKNGFQNRATWKSQIQHLGKKKQ